MIRVRFAPSPTGDLHMGNVRTALLNYIFSKKHDGKFVLRIEDTDQKRNVSDKYEQILDYLTWLGIEHDEGPTKGGKYAPYLQSERTNLYQEKLQELIDNQKVYRCFCSEKELEVRRNRQIALGQPPRYDRLCLGMSDDMIKQELVDGTPFVWRLRINEDALVEVDTLARGTMTFELKNFGDFSLTRSDGSFKFLFTNFVDDWLMNITHVIRGEDHLSNTAMQGALFDAFAVSLPKFWHLPLLCGVDGKKLSKREFGFSLKNLQESGFLPHAIVNYLAVSGKSFKEEIQSIDQLIENYDFNNMHSTGSIKFDMEKLMWFNHKWIEKVDNLYEYAKPFLNGLNADDDKLAYLVSKVKSDLKTLKDAPEALKFYFEEPSTKISDIENQFGVEVSQKALRLIFDNVDHASQPDYFMQKLKKNELGVKVKAVFGTLRYILTGSFSGISMGDLLDILDPEIIKSRVNKLK